MNRDTCNKTLEQDTCPKTIVKQLRGSIFKKTKSIEKFEKLPEIASYAFTLSICENERIGRKLWKNYKHCEQKAILDTKLQELSYGFEFSVRRCEHEVGPKNGVLHIHALVSMQPNRLLTQEHEDQMNSEYHVRNYKTIKIDRIWDEEGWEEYISKDIV